jgi:putative ABC transport system ATP-binding protein
MSEPFITCHNLVKIYKVAGLEVVALQGLDLLIEPGELLGIVGTSGSGKSTLLNILGGLDRPSAGQVVVGEHDLLKMSDNALDDYRQKEVGFVWQQTARNLIPYLSAQENVALPMTVTGMSRRQKQARTQELLEAVGLWEHRQHKLAQLSGGQQQRVAIAVALANQPQLLLGDEPTGELDTTTAHQILTLLQEMNRQFGLTTIIVTHDPQVARSVDRVITIRDGRTSSETVRRVADVEAALALGISEGETAVSPQHGYEEYIVVDGAGRLQIPPSLREANNIGDRVTLETTDEGVLIKPVAGRDGRAAAASLQEDEPPPPEAKGLRRWLGKLRS